MFSLAVFKQAVSCGAVEFETRDQRDGVRSPGNELLHAACKNVQVCVVRVRSVSPISSGAFRRCGTPRGTASGRGDPVRCKKNVGRFLYIFLRRAE